MNIVTLKKSILAAITVAVVATGSLSATTAPAAAGGKHFGTGLAGGIALGLIAGGHRRGYREDRNYYDDRRHYKRRHYKRRHRCWTERRWERNQWGERRRVRYEVCE